MIESDTLQCGVLITDIAGSVQLRSELGESAAGRRIHQLIDRVIVVAREHGVRFVKAYGDDMLAVFEQDPVSAAAEVAIRSQQLAADAGLQLYAGIHAGPVTFRHTDGHLDAVGQTINFVARLHKLTEDAPGQIFLVEESVQLLRPEMRSQAVPFGRRMLKGIGAVNVWTLSWHSMTTTPATVLRNADTTRPLGATLTIAHRDRTLRLDPDDKRFLIGRGENCALTIADTEPRISGSHLLVECIDGHWFLQDISRNGTWLREQPQDSGRLLPYCQKMLLPQTASVSLGRPFGDDADERFRLIFRLNSP